jgi:hypothetical protein
LLSESEVDINIKKFSSESLIRLTHEYSLNVQRLGLSTNAIQTAGDASLRLLLVDLLDALLDHTRAVHLDALDEPLQDDLLVLALEEREVCLDAVEVGAVWDIKDWSRF